MQTIHSRARRRTPQNAIQSSEAPPYPVSVNVTQLEATTDGVPTLLIQVEPEVLQLDGQINKQITWTLTGDVNYGGVTGPFFRSVDDVQFMTSRGKTQFTDATMDPEGKTITRTVFEVEEDQTIYTYLLTVRFMVGKPGEPQHEIAISIDPEVDNPPPAPR